MINYVCYGLNTLLLDNQDNTGYLYGYTHEITSNDLVDTLLIYMHSCGYGITRDWLYKTLSFF